MKGTPEVILVATLIMVATLAVVLGLISVLLAELYCSLLFRRRQLTNTNPNAIPIPIPTATTTPNASPSHASHPQVRSPPPPFTSIYAQQGVLQAPTSLLLPTVSYKQDIAGPKKQHSELHHLVVQAQAQTQESRTGVFSDSSPPASFISKAPPTPRTNPIHQNTDPLPCNKPCSGVGGEHLVYISNHIYESQGSGANITPFETPHTSPSRLETSGTSGEECDDAPYCGTHSPPLTPQKKLPADAEDCSVSVREDARSLGSDSHSSNGPSSSSSGSPFTSPSWRCYYGATVK